MVHNAHSDFDERRRYAVRVLGQLQKAVVGLPLPLSDVVVYEYGKDPYLLLVSCLLSLRAKDSKTLPIVRQLFAIAQTPRALLALPHGRLERLIYSIGFYKQKARTLREVSQELLQRFDGKVPQTLDDLLSIRGVGYKTANLILSMAYGKPAICVDVHVHRLSNMLRFVHTKTPRETELALQKLLPRTRWNSVNRILVMTGQNVATVLPRVSSSVACLLMPLAPKRVKLALKCKTPHIT